MTKLWLPWTRKSAGTHTCRICGAEGVPPSHIASCYRRAEDAFREQSIPVLLGHPDPELEDFMATHGGLDRPKGAKRAT